jgi:putative ABC transport system substrate-binding protein
MTTFRFDQCAASNMPFFTSLLRKQTTFFLQRGYYVLLLIVVLFSCATGCKQHSGHAGKHIIRIVTPVTHPSLDETIRGFMDGLAENGFSRNELDLRPDSAVPALNANGDFSAITMNIRSALADNPELIFVLSTPAATQAAPLAAEKNVPLVYAAVTDPVKAHIVSSMAKSDTLATGVSDRYPVDKQVELFLQLQPGMRTAAILLNPKEENSNILAAETQAHLTERGVKVRQYFVNSTSEITPRAAEASIDNDALIVNGDNLIVENIGAVVNVCIDNHRPLFVGDPDSVKKGAIATVGPSYYQMGRQAGFKAAQILKGKPAGSIPSDSPSAFDYIINTQAAKAMHLNIPSSIWDTRNIWISPAKLTQ